MTFQNHVIWITGASSGIGRALSLEFAKKGATVAVSARRMDELDKLVSEINNKALYHQMRFSDNPIRLTVVE